MELQEQIKIVKELLEATKELNGEYQEGWEEKIEDGERLLEYLKSKLKKMIYTSCCMSFLIACNGLDMMQ